MALTTAEVRYLAAHELSMELTGDMLADAHNARTHHGEYGRAVMELLTARVAEKIPSWWLADSDSAQQATPPAVAAYRARKLKEYGTELVSDVTCSIGTEGAAALGAGLGYLGSDISLPRVLMARHNLGSEVWLAQADALAPISFGNNVVIADPARRAGGRRIADPTQLIPPLPDLVDAYSGKELAIKCAPGIDYSQWDGLVSVVSENGAVKETCLYTQGFGQGREAILLGRKEDHLTSSMPDHVGAAEHGRYLIDPDGAIVRAGLVRHFAYRESLWMLDERIAYLTGDTIPAGYSGFEIFEQVSLKKLRSALYSYDAGSLEILVRGLDINPDQLRSKMKLRGSTPLAVVCTRIGRAGVALICGPRQWAATESD